MGRPKGSWTHTANPRWKGGRRLANGYVYLLLPSHPNSNSAGYVGEHISVMSEHLRRPIAPHEVVHHINGIRDDNRIENLIVMTRKAHTHHHSHGQSNPNSLANLIPMNPALAKKVITTRMQNHPATQHICEQCQMDFTGKSRKSTARYCSRRCYNLARHGSYAKDSPQTCEQCNQAFCHRRPQRFCSRICYTTYYGPVVNSPRS